ncbi:MAG: hypothetical protein NUV31_02410 [Dehalococcoidales bacterium]|nr:hypothetical protein [Dehalococcoidales bacterium]
MNTEQRLQGIEEEVKLLKNEIRSVLLDIKESLASGDWLTWSVPVVEGGVKAEVVAGGERVEERAEAVADGEIEGGAGRGSALGGSAQEVKGEKGSDEEVPGGGEAHHSPEAGWEEGAVRGVKVSGVRSGGLEVLRLVLLLEWLERSERELGIEETERVVEVYAHAGGLEESEREALKLLAGIMGKGSKVRGNLLKSLMELDGLMRRRDEMQVLQETVLQLLSHKESRQV